MHCGAAALNDEPQPCPSMTTIVYVPRMSGQRRASVGASVGASVVASPGPIAAPSPPSGPRDPASPPSAFGLDPSVIPPDPLPELLAEPLLEALPELLAAPELPPELEARPPELLPE